MYPAISGLQPEYGWEHAVRRDRRRPDVHRPAPQLPASPLRARRRRRFAHRRVPGRAHPRARAAGRAREGRRGVRLDAMSATPDPVDLLAFGPHPDDIEIGIGGTVAKHVRARAPRRPVRSDGRRDGQQRHRGRAAGRGRGRARGAGRAWRVNLRLPDRAIGTSADHARAVAGLVRRARPRAVAVPYWSDRHPDHVRASELLTEARVQRRAAALSTPTGEAWKPEWVCYYFINDHAAPSFVVDVSDHYETKRRALACHVTQFAPRGAGRGGHAADVQPRSSSSSRAATRSSARRPAWRSRKGSSCRQPVVRPHLLPDLGSRPHEHRHRLLRLGRRQRHRRHRARQGARAARASGALHQHRNAVPARRLPGGADRSTRC